MSRYFLCNSLHSHVNSFDNICHGGWNYMMVTTIRKLPCLSHCDGWPNLEPGLRSHLFLQFFNYTTILNADIEKHVPNLLTFKYITTIFHMLAKCLSIEKSNV